MNYRSKIRDEDRSRYKDRVVGIRLQGVRASSFFSHQDGCWVSALKCQKCAKTYFEESSAAEVKVVIGLPFLCIACDGPEADVKALRVTVKGVLFTW